MHGRRIRALALALAIVLLGAGCGGRDDHVPRAGSDDAQPGRGRPVVTFGTKNFAEQYILGELYAQALRARGWRVVLKSDIGSTEVTYRALTSGVIDIYPEYTGTILSVVAGRAATPRSARATFLEASRFMAGEGFALLTPTPFEDRDAVAVTKRFSRAQGGLRTMHDLRPLGARVTLGAAPEFRTRFAGLRGLRAAYGLREMRFKALPIGSVYEALDADRIQAADVFTTDGQLASGRYVVLEDPEGVFGFQNLVPVVDRRVLQEQGPEFVATLDAVSAELTNDVMRRLNAAVVVEGRRPADVARGFLQARGLL